MLDDIVIRFDDDFSNYLSDIRENEKQRIENERLRNEYFNEVLREKKMYYGRYRRFYVTTDEAEDLFELPNEYNEMSMVDVYVNGFYLNSREYSIEGRNVILTKPLDMVGTKVEIVVTRAIGIPTENFEELRGFSAYDVAVNNGFNGSVDSWMETLRGVGAYNRNVIYYRTTKSNEDTFELPEDYRLGLFKDVFVNGIKLNDEEYQVQTRNDKYVLVLNHALDVIGTVVEIDLIESDSSLVAISNDEIDDIFI